MISLLSLCHTERSEEPKTPQVLVYSSCGPIACACGLPSTLLSSGPLQHNICSQPLIQNTHILPFPGCQGPQKVAPSLWVSYLPTISLVYWPFLYRILVTCSAKASAISVQHCFLEYSPRATCLLWLVFILLDQALVLPCRCVHPSDPNGLDHDCGVAFTLTETDSQLLQISSSLTIINFQDPVSLLSISSGVSSNQTGGPCSFLFIVRHWSP